MNVKDAGVSNKASLDVMSLNIKENAENVKQAGIDISSNIATSATNIGTLATNVATAGTDNKNSLDALAGSNFQMKTCHTFCSDRSSGFHFVCPISPPSQNHITAFINTFTISPPSDGTSFFQYQFHIVSRRW